MGRIGGLVAVLTLACASAAAAQVRGDRVRVVSPEYRGEGVVVAVTRDTLVLTPSGSDTPVAIARATIERLDVALPREPGQRRSSFGGCALGAAIGAVAGAAVQAAGGGPYDGVDRRRIMWLAIGVGALGCAIGAALESGDGGVVWEPVVATDASAPGAGRRMYVGVALKLRR